MVDILNSKTLSHSVVSLRSDGIVEITINENVEFGEQECRDLMDVYSEILEPRRYPLLHIIENYVTVDKEAREFASSEEGLRFSKVEAFVINSLPHKLLANFYMKINKPSVPTKFFSTKNEAIDWLLKYV